MSHLLLFVFRSSDLQEDNTKFKRTWNVRDITLVIERAREALRISPDDSLDRPDLLDTHAVLHNEHFETTGSQTSLNGAITVERIAIDIQVSNNEDVSTAMKRCSMEIFHPKKSLKV